jgi:hypothetical protein
VYIGRKRSLGKKRETMRKIVVVFTILLISGAWLSVAEASISRGGGGHSRPAVGNRSAGNVNRGSVNRGNVNRGNINRGDINRGNVNRGNLNAANVNRGNINRGNINTANINNVNAHGWGNNNWVDDNHWGWGSFAGGAAAAVTGAAVGAAIADHNDNPVVVAPQAGTVVSTLPAGCPAAANTNQAVYSCGGAQYEPSYDGSDLVYQVTG